MRRPRRPRREAYAAHATVVRWREGAASLGVQAFSNHCVGRHKAFNYDFMHKMAQRQFSATSTISFDRRVLDINVNTRLAGKGVRTRPAAAASSSCGRGR